MLKTVTFKVITMCCLANERLPKIRLSLPLLSFFLCLLHFILMYGIKMVAVACVCVCVACVLSVRVLYTLKWFDALAIVCCSLQ